MIEGIVRVVQKLYDRRSCVLPDPDGQTYYVVPLLIAQAFRELRSDLVIPNDLVRDQAGNIVGCRSLARL